MIPLPRLQQYSRITILVRRFWVLFESLLQSIEFGAICVWGRVGEVSPPRKVLPILVEPQKPRLCIDARFLHL